MGGPHADACRDALAPFCELLKSPEHVHTYRITPISVWNAASAGMGVDEMTAVLERFSRFDLPRNVLRDVRDLHGRFGRLRMDSAPGVPGLRLSAEDPLLLTEVETNPLTKGYVRRMDDGRLGVMEEHRGEVKQALVKLGWPVEDRAGYVEGGAARDRAQGRARGRSTVRAARLPARLRRRVLEERRSARRERRGRAPLRRGQDRRRHRRHGDALPQDADPHDEPHRGPAVEAGAPREDDARGGRRRRVHGRLEGGPVRDDRDLPDPHAPQVALGGVHPPRPLPPQRLGAHRLRRGPPAPRAGLPPDGRRSRRRGGSG